MADWRPFLRNPRQRYRIDGDLLYWDAQGDTDLAEMAEHMNRTEQVGLSTGFVGVIIDMRGSTSLSFAARKHALRRRQEFGETFEAAISFVGGNVALRVITQLMMRAILAVTRLQLPIQHAVSEDEALSFCAKARRAYQAKHQNRMQ